MKGLLARVSVTTPDVGDDSNQLPLDPREEAKKVSMLEQERRRARRRRLEQFQKKVQASAKSKQKELLAHRPTPDLIRCGFGRSIEGLAASNIKRISASKRGKQVSSEEQHHDLLSSALQQKKKESVATSDFPGLSLSKTIPEEDRITSVS